MVKAKVTDGVLVIEWDGRTGTLGELAQELARLQQEDLLPRREVLKVQISSSSRAAFGLCSLLHAQYTALAQQELDRTWTISYCPSRKYELGSSIP